MPRSLLLFLALRAGVTVRDTEGVRQLLRMVATEFDETESIQITQTAVNTLEPTSRFWLRNVLGERPEPAVC